MEISLPDGAFELAVNRLERAYPIFGRAQLASALSTWLDSSVTQLLDHAVVFTSDTSRYGFNVAVFNQALGEPEEVPAL